MSKKDLASLMSGIIGDKPAADETNNQPDQLSDKSDEATDITPEMEHNLAEKRYQNVGRPRKGVQANKVVETRATFIVNPELVRKLKYISLAEGRLLKDVVSMAMTEFIDQWEAENGRIKLPKTK